MKLDGKKWGWVAIFREIFYIGNEIVILPFLLNVTKFTGKQIIRYGWAEHGLDAVPRSTKSTTVQTECRFWFYFSLAATNLFTLLSPMDISIWNIGGQINYEFNFMYNKKIYLYCFNYNILWYLEHWQFLILFTNQYFYVAHLNYIKIDYIFEYSNKFCICICIHLCLLSNNKYRPAWWLKCVRFCSNFNYL